MFATSQQADFAALSSKIHLSLLKEFSKKHLFYIRLARGLIIAKY
jgi:hypothetical protein